MILMPFLSAWLPPPPPPPWQPARASEYAATCHTTDVNGRHWTGTLEVTGQKDDRRLSFWLNDGADRSVTYQQKSTLLVRNPVSDGTYSFMESTPYDVGPRPWAVELAGLGPSPTTLVLTVNMPHPSPVFTEPAMIGLCKAVNIRAGSRFESARLNKEPSL